MKAPKAPVSWGELIDKITILELKVENLVEPDSIKNVSNELHLLEEIYSICLEYNTKVSSSREKLKSINSKLWHIEDSIREKERKKDFGKDFIELARSVYLTNDLRAQIKREINTLVGSELVEEKSYKPY